MNGKVILATPHHAGRRPVADRPIIFSGPMVKALLAGTKTQTRRPLREQPGELDQPFMMDDGSWHITAADGTNMSPLTVRYAIGDRLYVREAFCGPVFDLDDDERPVGEPQYFYRADGYPYDAYLDPDTDELRAAPPWRPSIHMPRAMSRLTLTITDVRVQRLQDIGEEDAEAEGVPTQDEYVGTGDKMWCAKCGGFGVHAALGHNLGVTEVDCTECDDANKLYRNLWNHLHGADAWDANPWVVAISFSVEHRNIDQTSSFPAIREASNV